MDRRPQPTVNLRRKGRDMSNGVPSPATKHQGDLYKATKMRAGPCVGLFEDVHSVFLQILPSFMTNFRFFSGSARKSRPVEGFPSTTKRSAHALVLCAPPPQGMDCGHPTKLANHR